MRVLKTGSDRVLLPNLRTGAGAEAALFPARKLYRARLTRVVGDSESEMAKERRRFLGLASRAGGREFFGAREEVLFEEGVSGVSGETRMLARRCGVMRPLGLVRGCREAEEGAEEVSGEEKASGNWTRSCA